VIELLMTKYNIIEMILSIILIFSIIISISFGLCKLNSRVKKYNLYFTIQRILQFPGIAFIYKHIIIK
jgi:hypothetical protein